eukprot:s9249_g1.t1
MVGAAAGGLAVAGAGAALVGTAWAIEGGLNAASHMMGWGAATGGGTDSDASRASRATDVQTLNGMQDSGAVDHFQVSSIPAGSTSYNVTVARAFTKLLGAFVTFRDTDNLLGECSNFEHPGDGSQFSANSLESQMQLGALQYPRYPMASDAEHFHFLEILAGTYDSTIKNMRISDNLWNNTQFICSFPVERVPKHPLSGISTRSGDLARFSFKLLQEHAGGPGPAHLHPPAFVSDRHGLGQRG